jgi:hypothetical protein
VTARPCMRFSSHDTCMRLLRATGGPCRAAGAAAGPSRSAGDGELQRLCEENIALRAALQQATLGSVAEEDAADMEASMGASLACCGREGCQMLPLLPVAKACSS